MDLYTIIALSIAVFFLVIGGFAFYKSKKLEVALEKREVGMKRKMYELAILKELGDRMGYSLNIQNVVEIITGSLQQFIDYSVVSYMFLKPEEIVFKVDLEKSVSRKFIDDIKQRMLKSLTALLEEDMSKRRIEEVLSGAVLIDDLGESVKSFFNIPLVIAGKVVGVLTIADVKEGLYKEEDMTILYKITQQASEAVNKLQDVVKTEQRKLNAMVESLEDGILMTDKDYRVMVANPSSKTLLGMPAKKDVSIFDFIESLKDKFDIREKLEESIKLNKILQPKEIIFGDRYLQISVLPVKGQASNGSKQVLGGTVVFHDITKEKELERIKEDFTSMIAHELRSPLDAVKKMVEVMRKTKTTKKDRDKYLEMVHLSSSNMLALISNLLDAAKIEAGKFEIFKKPENIESIVKWRIKFFEIEAKTKKINIVSNIAKNIPQEIILDSFRIGQVLNNFISNAIKFTPEKGKITVQVLSHQKGQDIIKEAKKADIEWFLKNIPQIPDSLIVAITDTGTGVSPENIPKLFNKFKQVGQVKSKGTGLGLVVSKGIIEAHKGTIGLNSEEGSGSTFYFSIPLNLKNDMLKFKK